MSRTDKDRPHHIQLADPANRRFAKAGHINDWATRELGVYTEWTWKKMSPASQCWCCSHRVWLPYKRSRRSSWRREVRRERNDMAQLAQDQAYWRQYAEQLQKNFAGIVNIDTSAEALEQYFSFEYWNDRSDNLLATVDFDGSYTTETGSENGSMRK